MGKLPDHLREERLLRERPAVAREVAALRTQRAQVVGELTGMARALRFVRFATVGIPFLRRIFGRGRTRSAVSSQLIDLLRRFGG
jgi:hypothetical protein